MVIWILHGKEILHCNMNSYFYADSIAKQLAAAPDNDVKA